MQAHIAKGAKDAKRPHRRKRVSIVIDCPPGRFYAGRFRTSKPFEVYINEEDHGSFKTEQDALDYIREYLRDESRTLVRLHVSQ
jgi:hypothetical protein